MSAQQSAEWREDSNLVARAKSGARQACVDIIQANYEDIYRFLLQLTRDSHAAADLTQETFRAAWERMASFQGRSSLKTWLHRIAYCKFVDDKRAGARFRRARRELGGRIMEPISAGPVEQAMHNEQSQQLYAAVCQLGESERAVIALHYFQNMTLKETAAIVGAPLGTVKWRLNKALAKLKSHVCDAETCP